MNIAPLPIRLLCDQAAPNSLFDLNRSAPPSFYRGDDIQIDIALAQNGVIIAPSIPSAGAGGIASVTAQLFVSENDSNAPMMAGTVAAASMNLTLTQQQWTNNSAAPHASFVFPNSQTSVPMTNSAATVNYWLRITAQTTDATAKFITFLDGPITVKDGPVTALSPPPLAGAKFGTIGGNLEFMILDRETGLYHVLTSVNRGGDQILEQGDTGY